MTTFLDTARDAWGEPVPDWIEVLARQCMASTQRQAAERIGYSAGLVSQVLRRTYTGNLAGVEEAVRGAWMGSTVTCPALGTIPADACMGWRRKAKTFAATSNHRVRMYRACTACPRNQKEEGGSA